VLHPITIKRGTRAPLVGEFKVEEGSLPAARSRGAMPRQMIWIKMRKSGGLMTSTERVRPLLFGRS
jgi:hypothetical protein